MIDLKKQLAQFTSGETAQKIIKNFAWLFFDKILRYAISMVVGIWLARYLAPAQYGIYSIAIAFPALFGAMANIGLCRITVRELVNRPEDKEAILGSTFSILLVSGFFFWGVTSLLAYFFYQADPLTFYLICIISLSFIFSCFESIAYYFEAQMQLKYYVYATNTAFIISNIIKVVLLLFESDLYAFAILYTVDVAFAAFSLVCVYHYKGHRMLSWKYSMPITKQLLRDGSPLIFAGLMLTINSRIDQIMLGQMRGETEVGLYVVAVKLVELWFFIPNIVRTSVFPDLVKSAANDSLSFHKKIERILHLLCLFSYLVIAGTLLLGDEVIAWLYKDAYMDSTLALQVLILLILFTSLEVIKNSYLYIHNWMRLRFFFSVVAASINVIANFILIPKYGMVGACYASLLSYGISTYVMTWCFPQLHQLGRIMTRSLFLIRFRKLFFLKE